MNRPCQRCVAFTLIELLVVVSILSLLISLLLPSMRRSREMARNTQCLARLKAVGVANMLYVDVHERFPDLNNSEDDGTWQYNYLIYDGKDFDKNFGPLVHDGKEVEYIEQLFCPVQKDPFHTLGTGFNPWPVAPLLDTRSGFGRRYHLSGKSLSQLKQTIGLAADVFHIPKVVKTAHKKGINAVYTDGHATWVRDPGILTDNDLTRPFDIADNEIVEDIWDAIDEALVMSRIEWDDARVWLRRCLLGLFVVGSVAVLTVSLTGDGAANENEIRTQFEVERVRSGDTLIVDSDEKLVYAGIRAPNRQEPLFEEARQRNAELVDGRKLRARYEKQRRDPKGRLSAYVYAGDTFVNETLVREGLALARITTSNIRFVDVLLAAQNEAREARLGLWRLPAPESEAEYMADPKYGSFHRPSCAETPKINPDRLVVLDGRIAAFEKGLVPCRRCRP